MRERTVMHTPNVATTTARALDRTTVTRNLKPVKANSATAPKRRQRSRKSQPRPAGDTKPKRWTRFAPELCGVMSGPSDLSAREGFVRG
jgi:hypothetical protein